MFGAAVESLRSTTAKNCPLSLFWLYPLVYMPDRALPGIAWRLVVAELSPPMPYPCSKALIMTTAHVRAFQ